MNEEQKELGEEPLRIREMQRRGTVRQLDPAIAAGRDLSAFL